MCEHMWSTLGLESKLVPVQVFSPSGEKMCLGNLQDILMILENKSMVDHVWTHVVDIRARK